MKAVKVIHNPETIRILADLVRREILRLIAVQPFTGTQLAEMVRLTKPSMAYHLQALLKAKLIKIGHTRIESHGILEKYYEPTAKLFIEDWEKTPLKLQRYFLHRHMERLRGMLSVFHLMAEKHGQSIEVSSDEIEELAYETARHIATVGKKYEKMEINVDRETLLIRIYSETIEATRAESKWKNFFSRIESSASCVLGEKD